MATNQRVLLVVNPISGGKDKFPIIESVQKELQQIEAELEIFKTTGKNDKEELTKFIKRFNPTRILSAGGDGTIKLIAEILKDDSIPVGIFPAGSANGLAENFNLPTEVDNLTKIALGDHFKYLDAIIVNGEFCLHISDLGLNAALIKNYEEGNIRGKLGYLIQSIPTLIKSDFPFQFTIKTEGKVIQRKAVLLGIANARRYGTGSTINPNGKYDDGKFEVLIFKELNLSEILKTFQEDVELNEEFVEIFSTSEANVHCEKKIPFQIDGEYRGEVNQVHAKISPVKIRIATPFKSSKN